MTQQELQDALKTNNIEATVLGRTSQGWMIVAESEWLSESDYPNELRFWRGFLTKMKVGTAIFDECSDFVDALTGQDWMCMDNVYFVPDESVQARKTEPRVIEEEDGPRTIYE